MKAIVIGAGGIARELLRRLGERWEITVVDVATERLARAGATRPLERIEGDGSSRVVLNRAGLESADAVIAATRDDDVNLEACRLAQEAGIQRLAAVAADPERLPDYGERGILAISPASLAARRIELSLENRRVSSMAFADGRAEAIEFRIAHDSPARDKPLRELHAKSWTAGAILRGGELVVPHGDTVFEENDLVTVVGASADFSHIVSTFTEGKTRFPLDFGKRIAVSLDQESDLESLVPEAIALADSSKASSLVLLHRDERSLADDAAVARTRAMIERARGLANGTTVHERPVNQRPARALAGLPAEESIGALVVPGLRRPTFWRQEPFVKLLRQTGRPVLVSRGSHPYRKILVSARQTPAGHAALRAAIDVARVSRATILAAVVLDPVFLSGRDGSDEARRNIAWVEEEAAFQGVAVEGIMSRGNPVRQLIEMADGADLIALGIHHGTTVPRQSVSRMVAARADTSILLVPFRDGN